MVAGQADASAEADAETATPTWDDYKAGRNDAQSLGAPRTGTALDVAEANVFATRVEAFLGDDSPEADAAWPALAGR